MPRPFQELAVIGRRLTEPLTGVGRYTECLLRHWKSQEIPFESIRLYVPGEPQLPADVLGGRVTVEVIPQKVSPLYWENVQLAAHLRKADLIFAPYTLPCFSASRGVVSNPGICDSRPADFSLVARLRTTPFFRHSVRSAVRVIASSESTRNDLAHLYRGATAFALPTEHEGFSLTIPEAMASGTLAIVFDHAALEAPAAAMTQIASDTSLRTGLRQ